MTLFSFRLLTVLLPFTLTACMSPEQAAAAAPAVDLGGSATPVPAHPNGMATGEGHEHSAPDITEYRLAHAGHDHEDAQATGTVNAVDAAQHKVTISHNPISDIGWPAMTMEFPVAPTVDLQSIKPGSRVNFTIEKGKDGMYQVQSVQPANPQQ
jgi:Cu/Ag efflux protein CusF